jgi:hypothetical protein
MHTTSRTDVWMNQPLAVVDSVRIPIYSNIELPVWAIFLAIYPLLSLLFFAISYVAFRYRWWKSGS